MSLAETKLITETEVKNWTDISTNIQADIIGPVITLAQDKYIRTAIGEALYIELLTQVKNNTLTALNTTLLNGNDQLFRGIKPALAWWTANNVYPYLHSKISPTGIQSRSTEDALSISGSELEVRRNLAKGNGEYYVQQLICFLQENDTDYPLFRDSTDCCTSLVYDGYNASGIVLDDDSNIDEFKKGLTREDLI